jgi:membrane-bound lytic murein transglycosylase D
MKNIQSKSLLTLIIIVFIIGFSTSGKNFIERIGETYLYTAPISSDTAGTLVKNPKWVSYPTILADHREESKEYVKQYSSRQRSYIIYMFKRGKSYFPRAVKIFAKYNVPYELQMLPALESNFNAQAVSPVGAVGYWQFMPTLARDYGLHIDGEIDERKDFTKSTIAAAKFFRDQLKYFNNDILLTVAAYNCGEGRVSLAIRNSGKENADFWDIKKYLPAETRKFVLRFVSLNVIAANYDKFLSGKLNFNEPHLVESPIEDSLKQENSLTSNSL